MLEAPIHSSGLYKPPGGILIDGFPFSSHALHFAQKSNAKGIDKDYAICIDVEMQQIDVRSVRESLGESQTAFAERFGVDQSTVHRWETEGLPERGVARHAVEKLLQELMPPSEQESAA